MAHIFNQVRLEKEARARQADEARHTKQLREQVTEAENKRLMANKIREEVRGAKAPSSAPAPASPDLNEGDDGMEYGEYAEGEEDSYQEARPSARRRKTGNKKGKTQATGLRRCAAKVSIQDTWKKLAPMLPHIPQAQYGAYFNSLRAGNLRDYRDLFKELLVSGRDTLLSADEKRVFARNKAQVSKLVRTQDKDKLRQAWSANNAKLTRTIVGLMNSLEPILPGKGKGKGRGKRSKPVHDDWEEDEEEEESDEEEEEEEEDDYGDEY